MWVQSSVWLFIMEEYNELLWFDFQEALQFKGAMNLDLESCLDVSKLDVRLDVFDLKSRVVGLISD